MGCVCKCGKPCDCDSEQCYECMSKGVMSKEDREK